MVDRWTTDVALPMRYELPIEVRVLLCLFAGCLALAGFALVGGLEGLGFACGAVLARVAIGPDVFVRLVARLKRRQLLPVRTLHEGAAVRAELSMLSARIGCRPPMLGVLAGPDVNAFALAGFRGDAILVTQGLLRLPADERTAVLAHELAHLRRRDALLVTLLLIAPMTLLLVTAGLAFGDGALVARVARLGELAPIMPNLLFLIAIALLLMNLSLRDRLEWAADTAAVEYAGARQPLITALRRRMAELGTGPACAPLLERVRRLQNELRC